MVTPPFHFPKDVYDKQLCILDTRTVDCFAKEHIPGSIHLPLVPNFISYAQLSLDPDWQLTLLLDEEERYEQIKELLSTAGIKKVDGYLKGGIQEWKNIGYPTQELPSLPKEEMDLNDCLVVDVRTEEEFKDYHIPNSLHIPLEHVLSLDKELASSASIVYLLCSGGTRSSIAASLLKRNGIDHVCNVKSGLNG